MSYTTTYFVNDIYDMNRYTTSSTNTNYDYYSSATGTDSNFYTSTASIWEDINAYQGTSNTIFSSPYSPIHRISSFSLIPNHSIISSTCTCSDPPYYKIIYNDYWGDSISYEREQREIKRNIIKENLKIRIKSRANPINFIKKNEERALETLREEITESEFRKYLKYGFVLVEGLSGKTYQIFRNEDHTKVWKNGRIVEEVCVRIKNRNIPLTDNIIAFKNMIQFDEEEFRKLGNIYKMDKVA